MKTELIVITPEYAEKLLKNNNINRLVDKTKIYNYSRQMTAGLWKEHTGESIKIASNGVLLDGQHRLLALIKSNISLEFLIISDLEPEIFTVIDTGKPRTGGDIFHISGVSNANNTTAGIRRYVNLIAGKTGKGELKLYSNQELLSLYNNRSKFWDATIKMSDRWYSDSKRILTQSEFIGLYACFYNINTEDAFTFINKLSNGVDLERSNPIYLLREKLLFAKLNKRFTLIQSVRTALVFKAWNLFRTGKTVKILKYDAEVEEFPKPI